MSPYSFEEHTSEVRVHLEAPGLGGLFEDAARALADLMTDGPPGPPEGELEDVTVRATDREALLVEWLDELIFRSETKKRIYNEVAVARASDKELVARIRGFEPARLKTAVKAATFHGLHVEERGGLFIATVVLDV
ncbi:MAG: archease [Myxococcaceae bacterium]